MYHPSCLEVTPGPKSLFACPDCKEVTNQGQQQLSDCCCGPNRRWFLSNMFVWAFFFLFCRLMLPCVMFWDALHSSRLINVPFRVLVRVGEVRQVFFFSFSLQNKAEDRKYLTFSHAYAAGCGLSSNACLHRERRHVQLVASLQGRG